MLTILYVVKNGILTLPRSLLAMRTLTKNIIVVDTGSEDGTDAWSEKQAWKFDRFPWCDDYSAARNYGLGLVKTPWVLVLDADEEVDKSCFDAIRASMKSKFDGFFIQVYNFIQDPHWIKQPMVLYGNALRLFRADKGFLYEGCVHEKLEGIKEVGQMPGAAIYHYQYHERENFQEKFHYYSKLMERKIHKEGWTFLNNVYYADLYRRKFIWTGDPEALLQAIKYLEAAQKIDATNKIVNDLCVQLKGVLIDVTKERIDEAAANKMQIVTNPRN